MSVSSVYVREIAQGDGVNTVFGFPWKFVAASDLMVYVDDVLQPTSAYEVKNPITKDRGEIVFRTAPAVGAVVVIRRMDNQQQTRLFKNQENFNAHEVEKAFDKLTLLVQEGFEELRRGALRMQSQSNLDYTIESLTTDDGMLALDLSKKTYKQTSFTQAQVQKVIDDAVRSVDYSVKNMRWDGDALVVSFSDGSTKKDTVSDNVAQIRAQHDDDNRWWLEWSLDGKAWQGVGGSAGGSVHNNLIERDAPDAHPISAISGLQAALAEKANSVDVYTKTEIDTALSAKADTAALTAEITRATNVEQAIQAALTAETTRATNAESALSDRITANADDIAQLETEVAGKASVSEVNTIKTDLGDLGDQVHGIEEKIPDAASAGNQLADKAFVNSSVQTATANFRGNWATWPEVPTDSNSYPVDYAGSKVPTVNDYLVVADASGFTGQSLVGTWRFKYSGVWTTDGKAGWLPEYQVNEEPLTIAQLAALNSGVSAALLMGMQQDIDANAGKTAELDADLKAGLEAKVDKNQGVGNAGLVLKVGADGEVIPGEGSAPSDGITITENASKQIQAIGIIEKNTGAVKYDWVGTLQDYQDQNIKTEHPEWICYITDDVSGGESVYTKTEADEKFVAQGHELVATQLPTAANGYTWYRKYADGWVEQGGTRQITITNDSGNSIVQLLIPMQNTNYFAVVQGGLVQDQSYLMYDIEIHSNSTINLVVSAKTSVASASIITAWEVKGMAA